VRLYGVTLIAACLLRSIACDAASLIDAVRAHRRDDAIALLNANADVNERAVDGTSALHWAVYVGDAELVARLLAAGANVTLANDYGSTPMAEAAERADAAIIKLLLRAGADVESPNAEGQTALMTVARTSRVDAAQVLLAHGANVNAKEQWRGQTALMWAAAQSQPAMVKLLLRHGARVNERSAIRQWPRKVTAEPRPQNRPQGGLTPLLFAAREGCAECARALVEAGASIDLADPDTISPLLMATLNARFDVAAYLIRAKANVSKWDSWGRSPLYAAVDYHTLPNGGRPDRPSLDKTTALETIALLLNAGANPNLQLKLFPPYRGLGLDRGGDLMLTIGTTPLIRAAKAGDAEAIELLLRHGALPNLPNSLRITPLLAAAGSGSTPADTRARFRNEQLCIAAAKSLLAAGAKVDSARDNGQTALHAAAAAGWNDFVGLLVAHGADLQAKDQDGLTALDIAQGKVGASGRARQTTIEVRKDTAELLQKLMTASSARP